MPDHVPVEPEKKEDRESYPIECRACDFIVTCPKGQEQMERCGYFE